MSEKIEKAVDKDEDWAILPFDEFDEEEDDKRWAKLTSEIEQLEKDVAETEAIYGQKILMNEPFREINNEDDQSKLGELF